MELTTYFDRFLANIEPTFNQRSEASTGHTTLRSRLKTDDYYKNFFRDSFLSGSYGRKTAIRPINDVDTIVVTWHSDSITPNEVLEYLERALERYYSNIRRQDRSVRVSLTYVTMDVVPARAPNGLNHALKIPDRSAGKWVDSHPLAHLHLTTELNEKRNGLYVPLVKALKRWRDYRMGVTWKPKSFLLECLVYYYARGRSFSSVPKGIQGFFNYVIAKYNDHKNTKTYSPIIYDPAETEIDVAKIWTFADFCKFMDEVFTSSYLADAAISSTDYDDSKRRWRQLLGGDFPLSL